MTEVKRPRVAAIGLDDAQAASIRAICGDLRVVENISAYTQDYSWTETDILVAAGLQHKAIEGVHLFALGDTRYGEFPHYITWTTTTNKERELEVSRTCPWAYDALAGRLSDDLAGKQSAPATIHVAEYFEPFCQSLVETSINRPVALRVEFAESIDRERAERPAMPGVDPIGLFLPRVTNLSEWFRAFLTDIHEIDPFRVPQLPPRLSVPSDWYTPEECALAERIGAIESEMASLEHDLQLLDLQRIEQRERADAGIRRAIWDDGEALVRAVSEVLGDLGFSLRNMDAEAKEGERKREDLRLTLESQKDWEAIVEVKGYTNGTRTNDARQIREHRERYRDEKGRFPDLTVWLANPFREMDPSSRPTPGPREEESAAIIDAVHVLSTDLYKQWALVKRGKLDASDVVKSLIEAEPGLWQPSLSPSSA